MKTCLRFVALFLAGVIWMPAWAQDDDNILLRDPRLRDEDISATEVQVKVNRLPDGLYEYSYDIHSPAVNKGKTLNFGIDIGCNLDFETVDFPEPPDASFRGDFSKDGLHVPVRHYRAVDTNGVTVAGPPSISGNNFAGWSLGLLPGESALGLRLVSPAPPSPRSYVLGVAMHTDDIEPDGSGWDYETYADTPGVPWTDDFKVIGFTTGPACAFAPPDEPPEPARFLGNGEEPEPINELLTYSAPLVDRFHLPADTPSVSMTIHYSSKIDPKTFKVEPGWARSAFDPAPGKTETVALPLKEKRSLYKLEVHTVKDQTPRKEDEDDSSYKDRDVFEIRLDPASQRPPGKPNGK